MHWYHPVDSLVCMEWLVPIQVCCIHRISLRIASSEVDIDVILLELG